jgi:hypothetical protein
MATPRRHDSDAHHSNQHSAQPNDPDAAPRGRARERQIDCADAPTSYDAAATGRAARGRGARDADPRSLETRPRQH